MNLAYLARIISNIEVDYDVIDCMAYDDRVISKLHGFSLGGMPISEAVNQISPETDIIGITSMFTSEWLVVRELSRQIKARFPDKTIILGGEHATGDAENIIQYEPQIDFVFRGESEDSLSYFLKNFESEEKYKTPGIVFLDKESKIQKNPKSNRRMNIDDLLPLWDKIPVQYYVDRKLSYSQLGKRAIPLLATRGCPYKCTFCTNEMMWGTQYTRRSPDSLIEEMRSYIERYNINHFDFIDLAMSVHKKWFEELLIKMKQNFTGISWEMTVGTRSEILDEGILKLIQESGNNDIGYAPETGSESMAKKIKKQINYSKFYESVRAATRLGFNIKANIIIGFPNETPRELFLTLWMAIKLGWMGVKGVSIFKFIPFKGSELGDKYFEHVSESKEKYEEYVFSEVGTGGAKVVNPIELIKNPRDQIYALLSNSTMILSYLVCVLRRPKYIRDFFVNIYQGQPVCAVEVAVYSILWKFGILKTAYEPADKDVAPKLLLKGTNKI